MINEFWKPISRPTKSLLCHKCFLLKKMPLHSAQMQAQLLKECSTEASCPEGGYWWSKQKGCDIPSLFSGKHRSLLFYKKAGIHKTIKWVQHLESRFFRGTPPSNRLSQSWGFIQLSICVLLQRLIQVGAWCGQCCEVVGQCNDQLEGPLVLEKKDENADAKVSQTSSGKRSQKVPAFLGWGFELKPG